ncbi:MAG: SAM-dependent methyltransferase [Azonexus sp.]|nr:SAM-dependent methyltransferase [Azonexus sp.]MCK6412434.1 SAM-dependent methyltransferase [Azonexus sp.]
MSRDSGWSAEQDTASALADEEGAAAEGNSRFIASAQDGPHRDLPGLLERHLAHPFRKPVLDYNRAALATALAAWRDWNPAAPLILDAGCGVGWSTLAIAAQYPDHFVLGVDQSLDRLQRAKPLPLPANALLLRADLVDFWRLLAGEGIRLARHYNLYPNPWPKIGHLARRWHGHAVFPVWRELGGVVECRSNWSIYIAEMALALSRLSGQPVAAEAYALPPGGQPMTPFEKKYLASGHGLWRCVVDFAAAAAPDQGGAAAVGCAAGFSLDFQQNPASTVDQHQ